MIARTTRTSVIVALTAAVGLLVAGCGGGSTKVASAAGAPGDPARAARTVDVKAGDDLRFQPDQVQVKVGETITFKINNTATIEHDFTLGDAAAQSAHDKEMVSSSSGGQMNMADEPNAIRIAPGTTKDITWTFTSAGTTLFGCHEPGHYASGMKGTITVS